MSAKTTIVIPVYGGADHLKRCIASLRKTVGDTPRLIIDDATPADRVDGLRSVYERVPKQFQVIVSEKNRGFAGANNFGVSEAKTPYVCLLNSDTQPQAYWLDEMEAILDSNA